MRFILAIVSFVVAAVLVTAGVAQKTVLKPADHVTATVTTQSTAPLTIIDGATLNAFPRTQSLSVGGSSEVFAAYGRTTDVMAWVGKATYNKVTYDATTKQLATTTVRGSEQTVPTPKGSDLWLQSYDEKLTLDAKVLVPKDVSFIIASDGTDPAPADIALTWPMNDDTPWSTPLMLGGGAMLVLGLVLLLWAFVHLRRSRGPRRRSPRMPKLPKQPRFRPAKKPRAVTAGRSRRSATLTMAAMPLAAIALVGCSAASGPTIQAQTVATSSPSTTDDPPPVVSDAQGDRIVKAIGAVAAKADKAKSTATLSTRFAGPARAARIANYKMRNADAKIKTIAPIPTGAVELLLPQKSETWPRTVLAIVGDGASEKDSTVQTVLMLVQDDPRSNYQVHYAMTLTQRLPDVPVASVGTYRLLPDVSLLEYRPDQIAAMYGDVLLKDKSSESYSAFDTKKDLLLPSIGLAAKHKQQKDLPSTVKLAFSNAPGDEEPIVLATISGGALVAVDIEDLTVIRPVQSGASVTNPSDTRALSGKATTTRGMRVTYGDQLLFYVPPATDDTPMQLLAFASAIETAVEVPKK